MERTEDTSDRNWLLSYLESNPQKVRSFLRLMAIFLGLLQMFSSRHVMNADGIAYLDLGDAYFRRDWNTALNGTYGPFYPWFLGAAQYLFQPSQYFEFTVVHVTNFLIYLIGLCAFEFFLTQSIRSQAQSKNAPASLTEWMWISLSYPVFMLCSLQSTGIGLVTPDLLVQALVCLAAGISLKRRSAGGVWLDILLGVALGFGYLAKTVMFLIAFLFFGAAAGSEKTVKQGLFRFAVMAAAFALISGPLIMALSSAKGRFTIGESGKMNYLWMVDEASTDHCRRLHPERVLEPSTQLFDLSWPISATYLVGYDYSLLCEGASPRFDLKKQVRALLKNLPSLLIISTRFEPILIWLFILVILRWGELPSLSRAARNCDLGAVAIGGLLIYSLVYVEERYVGCFFLLLFVGGFFPFISASKSGGSSSPTSWLTVATAVTLLFGVLRPTYGDVRRALASLSSPKEIVNPHWTIARELGKLGVSPGDKVVVTAVGFSHHWARLARVQIVGEMLVPERFWTMDAKEKNNIFALCAKLGARAIVAAVAAENPPPIPGWHKIENVSYYVRLIEPPIPLPRE